HRLCRDDPGTGQQDLRRESGRSIDGWLGKVHPPGRGGVLAGCQRSAVSCEAERDSEGLEIRRRGAWMRQQLRSTVFSRAGAWHLAIVALLATSSGLSLSAGATPIRLLG